MDFKFTPREAWSVAEHVATHYRRRRFTVTPEVAALDGAPLKTTLHASKANEPLILVEAQGTATMIDPLKRLARLLGSERVYSELYVATWDTTSLTGILLGEFEADGIGVLNCSETGEITRLRPARNPALVITPDPLLKYGHNTATVQALVKRYNSGERKEGLRDLCDLVELETRLILEKAVSLSVTSHSAAAIGGMRWADQINVLAAADKHPSGVPVLENQLKDDCVSFKGARNLLSHPGTTAQQRAAVERQYGERMMLGTRLIADLGAKRRSLSQVGERMQRGFR